MPLSFYSYSARIIEVSDSKEPAELSFLTERHPRGRICYTPFPDIRHWKQWPKRLGYFPIPADRRARYLQNTFVSHRIQQAHNSPRICGGKRGGKFQKSGLRKYLGQSEDWPKYLILLVGAAGFELATPCTPCKCATRLRYAPTRRELYLQFLACQRRRSSITDKISSRMPPPGPCMEPALSGGFSAAPASSRRFRAPLIVKP